MHALQYGGRHKCTKQNYSFKFIDIYAVHCIKKYKQNSQKLWWFSTKMPAKNWLRIKTTGAWHRFSLHFCFWRGKYIWKLNFQHIHSQFHQHAHCEHYQLIYSNADTLIDKYINVCVCIPWIKWSNILRKSLVLNKF